MLPALLEESATPHNSRVRGRLAMGLAVALCAVGLAACGGGERQDEGEPEGEFPVEVVRAEFPAQQRLAETTDLVLEVTNTGDETIPDLAATVFTQAQEGPAATAADAAASEEDLGATDAEGNAIPESQLDEAVDEALQEELDEQAAEDAAAGGAAASDQELPEADGAFSVISTQKGLSIPSRPVWILEQGYPALLDEETPAPPLGETAAGSGAEAVQTDTFSFGELDPGETATMIWRVTAVQAGEYTVRYRLAAGLQGMAVAVNDDGSVPEGEFVVVIDDAPPQTRVNDKGEVVPIKPEDLIGQAGSDEQQSELTP